MRGEQTRGDLDRTGSAEDLQENQLPVWRSLAGIDSIEAAEWAAGDRHVSARRKGPARRL